MAHWRKQLRRILHRYGYDFQRVGTRQLGRDHMADIRLLCGGRVQTIFDVGANIGQAAMGFADEFREATIYSFEPFPEAFSQLVANVSQWGRVHPQNLALGEKHTKETLHVNQGSELNSFLVSAPEATDYISADHMKPRGECHVSVATLDQFCVEQRISQIDLLKIDTQGFELHVLKGAERMLSTGAVRVVFLEVNFVPLYQSQPDFGELNDHLHSRDFHFVGFYDATFSEAGYLKWADALFVRPRASSQDPTP
jgi:FkbM family methyltransferase